MNEFFSPDQIKEEAYKCSKCALCRQICPAFARTKNELLCAKGRCLVLQGIFDKKLKLKKRFVKTFEECLNCNKCKEYCPSSIDMEKIAKSIEKYYFDTHKIQKFILETLYKISKGKFGLKP